MKPLSVHLLQRQMFIWLPTLAGLLVGVCSGCKPKIPPPGPTEVLVAPVAVKDVPICREWVGTTDGITNATIRAQVTGYLFSQNYEEGRIVKKDDLLFRLDPRTFEAALDQAKGNLAQAEAQLGKTELDVKRYTPLAKEQAISQQELDDAIQSNLAAKAQVQAGKAAVEQAQLSLNFTRITSPIPGIVGISKVGIGDLISPSSGELTTVSIVDPIRVHFFLSEQEYLRAVKQPKVSGWGKGGLGPELALLLADGSTYPHKGRINAVDRQVDDKTGTIHLTAHVPNPDLMLRPGLFVRVKALIFTVPNALVVPQRAVNELQGKYQVAVVGADGKVSIRPVKVSERFGSDWMVEEGLKAGELVVVEGVQKARDGMTVVAKPFVAPSASQPAPEPKPTVPSTPASKPQHK
ncbi:MAG: efflux RND transporter periplasmic adaptor subunit [Verrucomicrobia bacterium]|nr:efflux RND transporter periplasmic adaptor subunit [Verrucomicrobiota bacterium]